jgi:uncharacterized membrane protein YedE/YeeE
MSSPETIKVVGYVLCGISIFALIVWSAATMGYWPDLRDKEARSSWEMHKKYSPLWWQRFSRWLLIGAFLFGVFGYWLSGPHPKQEPRRSLWQQLFSRDK